MIDWVPSSLRQRLVETLVERVADAAERLSGRPLAEQLRGLFAQQGPRRHDIEAAMARAAARVAREAADPALGTALADECLWQNAPLRKALLAAVMRLGVDDA